MTTLANAKRNMPRKAARAKPNCCLSRMRRLYVRKSASGHDLKYRIPPSCRKRMQADLAARRQLNLHGIDQSPVMATFVGLERSHQRRLDVVREAHLAIDENPHRFCQIDHSRMQPDGEPRDMAC